MPLPIVVALLVLIGLCIIVDLRTRSIPNAISAVAMLAGVALNTIYFGTGGLVDSLVGLLAPIAVLLLPFALGGIGGGDVKMMGAVGALLGPSLALTSLCVGVIVGGVIVMVHLARRGRLREKLRALRAMMVAAAATRSIEPLSVRADDAGAVALPYSVPLGLGTIAVVAVTRAFGCL